MHDPTVLTVILNYRTPDLTLRATQAALKAMQDLPGEVLIVDNGSGDGSFDAIARGVEARGWDRDGRLRLLATGRNGGFGAGMNFGMRVGLSDGQRADFVYLLNSDAWPEAEAIRSLRDFMIDTPDAGIAGSFIQGEDGVAHQTAFRFPSAAGEFEMAARTSVVTRLCARSVVPMPIPKDNARIDWTAGASLMLRGDMLDRIGGFDETFFLYFEETELSQRAAQAGWQTWFVPASRVTHVGSVSTGQKTWARMPGYWLDSRWHYFAKTRGVGYAAWATVTRVAGTLIYDLRRLLQRKPQADPDFFLRDLTAHAWRRLFRRRAGGGFIRACAVPLTEDPK